MGVDLICKDGSSASSHGGECPEDKKAREAGYPVWKKKFKKKSGPGSMAEDVGKELDMKKVSAGAKALYKKGKKVGPKGRK